MTKRLPDGTLIEIRPLGAGDREALREGFERLSPESRYRRFFGPMAELSERDLDYLTQIDHHDHEALVAFDARSGEGLGVARYVRIAPAVAEPAVTVTDDWHGRGVGTALLVELARRAREEGVWRFEAPVLAGNSDAIRVFERLGTTTKRRSGREIELTIELPARPAGRGPWAVVVSRLARQVLAPVHTLATRLWPRRSGAATDERRNLIVVGTDASEHSGAALEVAAGLAELSGARVQVVGAFSFLSSQQAELTRAVREAAEALRARGLEAGEELRRGDPALALTDAASEWGARLIVVGGGQRSKATRRLIGSVADYVSERSPCNVLIVRHREGTGEAERPR
jgi:nucleotide-binding universal stress UspA family protein/GNAT superfamily N-acetyltransferase